MDAVAEGNLSTYAGLSPDYGNDSDGLRGTDRGDEEDEEEDDEVLGVWDGYQFVYTQTEPRGDDNNHGGSGSKRPWEGWYDILRLLWRYGLAPLRIQRLVGAFLTKFLAMYEAPLFPFADLTEAVARAGLSEEVGVSAAGMLAEKGLAGGEADFAHDIVQAATRVNYASNLGELHGVAGMVCLAAEGGARAVQGGNWRIFEGWLARSGAEVRLGTEVTEIRKDVEDGGYVVQSTSPRKLADGAIGEEEGGESEEQEQSYDTVILAAPFHQTSITFPPPPANPLAHVPGPDEYRTLHVTLFSSPHRISPAVFNLPSGEKIPDHVLTTTSSRHANLLRAPPFYSISTLLSAASNPHSVPPGRRERVYKVFSPEPLPDLRLAELVGVECATGSRGSDGEGAQQEKGEEKKSKTEERQGCKPHSEDISWVYRKTWLSYPVLKPRSSFEPLRLDEAAAAAAAAGEWHGEGTEKGQDAEGKEDASSDPLRRTAGGGGLWYTAGMESFISTMETSALMGRNVARLVVDGWG